MNQIAADVLFTQMRAQIELKFGFTWFAEHCRPPL
jgi:hypothetical protein